MKTVKVGDAVQVVDENGIEHTGLVTANWQNMAGEATYDETQPVYIALNVVFVSADSTKTDSYGRQTEHLSSCMHRSVAGTCPGRYWYQA
jgi:hypothetical protein